MEDGSEQQPPPVGLDVNSAQFMKLRQACEMGEPRACTIFGAGLSQDRLPILLQRRSPGICAVRQPPAYQNHMRACYRALYLASSMMEHSVLLHA